MLRPLLIVLVLMFVPTIASAQQLDFGRFRLGMSVAEVRSAAPEQSWREQALGADLILLRAERPVRIGRISLMPLMEIRHGRLSVVSFGARGLIRESGECDRLLADTVSALEPQIGALDGSRAPDEFGAAASTQTTSGRSEIRYYSPNATVRAGFATQRGERFVEISSRAAPMPQLACEISVLMMTGLNDFEAPLAPTTSQLAAAQEIEPEWAIDAGPEVTQLTMPAEAIGYTGPVRVELDCLVIDQQRLNCAIASEQPPGMHFGDAALASSRFNRIEPVIDGEPTQGKRVRFTIRYEQNGIAPQ